MPHSALEAGATGIEPGDKQGCPPLLDSAHESLLERLEAGREIRS